MLTSSREDGELGGISNLENVSGTEAGGQKRLVDITPCGIGDEPALMAAHILRHA